MQNPTTVLFRVSEHVAYITLNRPAAANSVNLELAQELEGVARECDGSRSVRAVLLNRRGIDFLRRRRSEVLRGARANPSANPKELAHGPTRAYGG
jgi:Enoyl-CoA hydratase/isomerase